MIEIYFKTIKDPIFKQIQDFRTDSWIHLENADSEDLNKIAQLTNLEFSDLSDSLDKHEIPRLEHKGHNIIIFIRHPAEEEIGLHTATLTIVLTPSYIITISPHESKLIDSVVNSKINLATTQKHKLMLFFILKTTQEFTSKIKKVRYAVIEQEKKLKNVDNSAILMLSKNEEKLNQYLSSLAPMKILLEALGSGRILTFHEKDKDLLEDLFIAIRQSEDLCRVNVRSIRSLREAYQILFTNDVNKTIKLLTAITIIFTIPTIIASIYGMNVILPLATEKHAFSLILLIMLLCSVMLIIIFIKKKWL